MWSAQLSVTDCNLSAHDCVYVIHSANQLSKFNKQMLIITFTSVASAAASGIEYSLFPILFPLSLERGIPKRYLWYIYTLLNGLVTLLITKQNILSRKGCGWLDNTSSYKNSLNYTFANSNLTTTTITISKIIQNNTNKNKTNNNNNNNRNMHISILQYDRNFGGSRLTVWLISCGLFKDRLKIHLFMQGYTRFLWEHMLKSAETWTLNSGYTVTKN